MIPPPRREQHEMLQRELQAARAQWEQSLAEARSTINPANVCAAVKENPITTAAIVVAAGYIGSQLLRVPLFKGLLRVSIGVFTKAVLKNLPGN